MSFITHAQNFEDVLLWRALQHVQAGFYVDVGANDPVEHSVTKSFYDVGWRGINIEPLPVFHEAFLKQRTGDINLAIAAGASDGEIVLYDVPAVNGWASSDPDVAAAHRAEGYSLVELRVPMRTLNSVLAEHVRSDVHFLKIDVEGFEREVLLGLDLSRWRPWILVIEATMPNSRETNHETWEPLVTSHAYVFAYFDGLNRYYVAEEHLELLPQLSVQANVFDGFISSHLDNAWRDNAALRQLAEQAQQQQASLEAAGRWAADRQQQLDEAERVALDRQQQLDEAERVALDRQQQLDEAERVAIERQQQLDAAGRDAQERQQQLDEAARLAQQRQQQLDGSSRVLFERQCQFDDAARVALDRQNEFNQAEAQALERHLALAGRLSDAAQAVRSALLEAGQLRHQLEAAESRANDLAVRVRVEVTGRAELEGQLREASTRSGELASQLHAANAWGNDLDNQLRAARSRSEELALTLEAMHRSTSWRVSKPVRLVGNAVRCLARPEATKTNDHGPAAATSLKRSALQQLRTVAKSPPIRKYVMPTLLRIPLFERKLMYLAVALRQQPPADAVPAAPLPPGVSELSPRTRQALADLERAGRRSHHF